jgi:iron complex transport system ATP-binding protein
MSLVELKTVSIEIGARRVVDRVSLTLEGGGVTGLIGPNGAGKTTVMRAIAQLLPLARGEILFDGRLATTISAPERAKHIAYLPQGGQIHWPLIVRRLVALGRFPHLNAFAALSEKDTVTVNAALEGCDVLDLADRPVTSLSGGERSLVLLARALAVGAPVLLADEPAASLDPAHQIQVMELLRGQAAAGRAVLVVLHDLPLATRYCDRLILLGRGTVVADGAAEAVLTPTRLREVYGVEAQFVQENGRTIVVPQRRIQP